MFLRACLALYTTQQVLGLTFGKFTENLTLKGSNSYKHGQRPWLKDKVQSVLACVFGTKTMTKHEQIR